MPYRATNAFSRGPSKNEPITVALGSEERRKLDEMAEAEGVARSVIIRALINRHYENNATL